MSSERIDRVLRNIKALRLLRMALHTALLATGAYLLYLLVIAAAEKYLFYYPLAALTLFGPLLLYLLIRVVQRFHSDSPAAIASSIDNRYGLKDRVSTYVELRSSEHPFLQALISETENQIGNVSVIKSADFARGAGAPALFAAIPAICLVVLPYLPVPDEIANRVDQHKRIATTAKVLEQNAARIEKEAEKLPELKKTAEEIKALAKEIQKPTTDPAEALKKLNAGQDKIRRASEDQKKLQKDALARDLKKLMAEGKAGDKMTEAQKRQMEEAAKELEKALADKNLEGGKEAAEAMRQGKMSKEQMEKMKQAMEKFEKEQEETQQRMAELQKSLENTKKSAQGGKAQVTYNSKLDERKVDKGKGGVEDGPGTTNQDSGPSKFDTRKQGKGEYAQDLTKAEYEQLYKGQRENAGSDPLFVDGQWDPQSARYVRVRTFGVDSDTNGTHGSAETAQQSTDESVIGKEKVPASYRKAVKKYFESIQQ